MKDARGAVFVEKLIALLPLLLVFFVGWQLAEVAAAQLVVQRASAAAGRAAMVVLPDDPQFYGDEPRDSYTGTRRAEIELAAGMVLSAIPQMSEDFAVEVTDPPQGFGSIDVTVRAPYDCGNLGLLCSGGALTLSATTKHAYHGARYEYSVPVGSGSATPDVGVTAQGLTKAGSNKDKSNGKGDCEPPAFRCNANGGFATNNIENGRALSERPGRQLKNPNDPLRQAALAKRCKEDRRSGKNYAALRWECDDGTTGVEVESSINDPVGDIQQHAELVARDKFLAKKPPGATCWITDLYTEREPCPGCRRALIDVFRKQGDANASQLPRVRYSFRYNLLNDALDPGDLDRLRTRFGERPCDAANLEAANLPRSQRTALRRLAELAELSRKHDLVAMENELRAQATRAAARQQCP